MKEEKKEKSENTAVATKEKNSSKTKTAKICKKLKK